MVYVTPPEQSIRGSSKTIMESTMTDEEDVEEEIDESDEEDEPKPAPNETNSFFETIELANMATQAIIELSSFICAACICVRNESEGVLVKDSATPDTLLENKLFI